MQSVDPAAHAIPRGRAVVSPRRRQSAGLQLLGALAVERYQGGRAAERLEARAGYPRYHLHRRGIRRQSPNRTVGGFAAVSTEPSLSVVVSGRLSSRDGDHTGADSASDAVQEEETSGVRGAQSTGIPRLRGQEQRRAGQERSGIVQQAAVDSERGHAVRHAARQAGTKEPSDGAAAAAAAGRQHLRDA